ncbi:MAG: ribosomal RNA small subunit methyltransferase A [Acidobacteria bacterium]|nr:ribosomal RNA small subunit methyltransferase A [Acidobacteriota bacterium]
MPRPHSGRPRPRPPLGQHFLADARVRRQILARLNCRPEDCWLEIGAGHGEMTLGLAEASRVVAAVERDPKLAETLRTRLAGFPGAHVVEGDILEVLLAQFGGKLSCPRWRVYGNLPYYITSPILQHLFAALELIADIHIVVQREVAERLLARPGGRDYGYLSVVTQVHTTPEILQAIPRGAFRPAPQVESALVRLEPPGKQRALGIEDAASFLRFVGLCFRQKRKTLANNLRSHYGLGRVQSAVEAAGLSARARGEELSLEDFARLFRLL